MIIAQKLFILLSATAVAACAQSNFSICDINRDGAINVKDIQAITNQALGAAGPANDLTGDGAVNIVDVASEIAAVLYGCPYYSVTPRFAIQSVTVLNQAYIPADIPSAGNLTVTAVAGLPTSVMNQAWISADIPSAGNLAVNAVSGSPVTVVNQAWISADIPSPGDVGFVVGLAVSVNNTAVSGSSVSSAGVKVLGGGHATTPVDLASVHDGDGLVAGQTIRFRVYPPGGVGEGSDFLVDGTPRRVHGPSEMLLTVPANAATLDLQAVIYLRDGSVWRTPVRHLLVAPDPGQSINGRAAPSAAIAVRANGLAAEYYRADRGMASWSELQRTPDRLSVVTAINQPDAMGVDPFGTAFPEAYATRFHGQILVQSEGPHQFFLDAPQGGRLVVDGSALIDGAPGTFAPESTATMTLTSGWHSIEVDSFQTAAHTSLQLSWRQPNSAREIVRPEALAADLGALAVADATGSFRLELPAILQPLEWHPVPAGGPISTLLEQK